MWPNFARQHQVVPVPRSHHAGMWSNIAQQHQAICALRVLRPFLWFDFKKKDRESTGRGRILRSRSRSSGAMRSMLTMKCSSPWCTTQARHGGVRWPALEDVESTTTGTDTQFSWSLLGVWQYATAVHGTAGTRHRFQVPAESLHAVATSSLRHVPDLALKLAGLLRV